MIWLAFVLHEVSTEIQSISPTYLTGFISDMSEYKQKRVISNYVNVTEENMDNSEDIKYLVTKQSAVFRTIASEDWSGYINAQQS